VSDDKKKYRLVTRSDFDGLVCAVLFKELGMIDDIKFVHPKDMQDGVIDVTSDDITTNLPYVEGAHLAFDHHLSETIRLDQIPDNYITNPDAPSAARVVYEHFGGAEAFPNVSVDMMEAVDKGDSAQLSEEEILKPTGWVLLNYLMDARTGLGRFRHFRISNYQLMMELIDMCRSQDIEDILYNPDVRERVVEYMEQAEPFKEQLKRCAKVDGNVVVLDLREEETIHVGNRFMIYALFPEVNVSVHVIWGLRQQNTVFAIGKSITNRSSKSNIGALCLEYGGGGHENAGTMQVENDDVVTRLEEVVARLKADG
jgi:nanoRNase/pAp phosphatase (c-di-AMP/oligoRNAs hydrolase)